MKKGCTGLSDIETYELHSDATPNVQPSSRYYRLSITKAAVT